MPISTWGRTALAWVRALYPRYRQWRTDQWRRRLGLEAQIMGQLTAFLDPYAGKVATLERWVKQYSHHLCEEDRLRDAYGRLDTHDHRIRSFEGEIGKLRHHFCERDRIAEIERELMLLRIHLCDAVVKEPLRSAIQQWRGLAGTGRPLDPVLMAYQMKLQVVPDADE